MRRYPYCEEGENFFIKRWTKFWMRYAGLGAGGRIASRFAAFFVPPYKKRVRLASLSKNGFIESTAVIHHPELYLGDHCFIGDRVVLFERCGGGPITFGRHVQIYRDTILETGRKGYIEVGDHASVHPGCVLFSYVEPIKIGSGVMIASNCSLYSYDHGVASDELIRNQDPVSKGPISIGDESWLGCGAIVLSGVSIGQGAVIGAGSIVAHDVPDKGIAVGSPAKVVKIRP